MNEGTLDFSKFILWHLYKYNYKLQLIFNKKSFVA